VTLYSAGVVAAVVIGVLVGSIAARDSNQGASYSGDYPAFYGAGEIAADGDWAHLYDLSRQMAAQRDLQPPGGEPSARFFSYPPQVALLYEPLASLPFYTSYLLHTMLMGLLLVAALWLARPMVPWLPGRMLLALAAALVFWPMFRTISGGSNTALTLFLIVGAWRLVEDERPFLAGLVLAVLFYKPQFAIPLIGLYLLRRHWRVLAGAATGALAFYLTGIPVLGWNWVGEWVDVVTRFGRLDAELNGHSAISLVGFAENLYGVGTSLPVLMAWGLVLVMAAVLIWLWWRSPSVDLGLLMAVTMPGVLLISPHAMSHDGALVVLTAAVAAFRWPRRRWLPWLVIVWLLGASQAAIKQLGFSPGLPMLLICLAIGWSIVSESRSEPAPVV
jgi:alpha-1,2-mannosyltransferase